MHEVIDIRCGKIRNASGRVRNVVARMAANCGYTQSSHVDPFNRTELLDLLELTSRAPSAGDLQPWRFLVVREPEAKQRLLTATCQQREAVEASALIVLYSDMVDALNRVDNTSDYGPACLETDNKQILRQFSRLEPEARESWRRAQTNTAIRYVLTIAASFGFSSSPIFGFKAGLVRDLFCLPLHVEISAVFTVEIANSATPQFS